MVGCLYLLNGMPFWCLVFALVYSFGLFCWLLLVCCMCCDFVVLIDLLIVWYLVISCYVVALVFVFARLLVSISGFGCLCCLGFCCLRMRLWLVVCCSSWFWWACGWGGLVWVYAVHLFPCLFCCLVCSLWFGLVCGFVFVVFRGLLLICC